VNQNNVVNLDEFREKKKPSTQKLMAFEPGQYYIYPDMGMMVHCLFITDKSHSYENKPIYVMEDQYGNLVAEIMDDETCKGWHLLHEEVFIEAHKRFSKNPDPEPPRPVAG
tara:strand:- start:48 stop:380 length:333 start_codon:yes stop_codon:yes gene_type:complete